jgi:sugar lactone lactonase YvrE
MSVPQVSVVLDVRAKIGEGPHYDPTANELIWVDIDGMSINFLQLSNGSNRKLQLNNKPSIAIPCTSDPNRLLVFIGRDICIMNRKTGEIIKVLCSVEPDKIKNQLNDAKCDSQGRLWCGTFCSPSEYGQPFRTEGSLYSFDGVTLTCHMTDVGLSNGIEWSLDETKMYYIDSLPKLPKKLLYSFTYDKNNGTLSDRKVLVDYNADEALGLPDGMCRDSEGMLWIASHSACAVSRWNPSTGEKLMDVILPAVKPTSCCFGGPN